MYLIYTLALSSGDPVPVMPEVMDHSEYLCFLSADRIVLPLPNHSAS